jgi:hypothetical protein
MRVQQLITWKHVSAATIAIAFAAWAVSPHYKCIDKEDLTGCDSDCNGRCDQWSYTGKECKTCTQSAEDGINECTPVSPAPRTVSGTYQRGDCNDKPGPPGAETWPTACECVNLGNPPTPATKNCDC